MRTRNLEEIEFIRRHIENLSFPLKISSEEEKEEEKEKEKEKNIKSKYKINNNNKNKSKEKKEKELINKNFDEIYEIYNNDKEYKKECEIKERIKSLKSSKIASFQYNGKLSQEKKFMNKKFNLKDFMKILDKNEHQSRNETVFEDDFSSSDSYDSDLFYLNKKVPKDYKIRTKEDLIENEDNLLEIMRVLNLNQK